MGVYLSVSPPDGFDSWDEAAWDAWLEGNPWEPAELLADRGHWLVFLYQARVHAPRASGALSPFLERLMNERPVPAAELPGLRDAFDLVARELAQVPASRLWTGTQFYTVDELHQLILRAEEESAEAQARFTRRITVEAVHELGHGMGLVHCVVPDCAMHRSLWPEGVDLKRPEYCPACLATLSAL